MGGDGVMRVRNHALNETTSFYRLKTILAKPNARQRIARVD